MWTPAALGSEARPWAAPLWRVVESQARVSTLKLVDSLAEQAALEALLDGGKPPLPPDCAGLHYLLAAPFRYAPYPHGSRFRRARQRAGAFYAAETTATAMAEAAFYRLLFHLEAPTARRPANPTEHTAFRVRAATARLLDLTRPPLERDAAAWTHPTDYAATQDLADAARAAAVGAIRYRSVRDPAGGANLALLTPAAFAAPAPDRTQTWHVFVRPRSVQATCENPRAALEYPLADGWAADPRVTASLAADR